MAYLPPMNGGRLNASISSAAGGSVFGASLMSTGTMNLVAGNNITLSQSTNATGANITLSAPYVHNVSFGGNMAGAAAMVSTGTLSLFGGNNITLSQNANNVTINGPTAGGGAGSNTIGMSNIGNTTGNAGFVSGSAIQYAFSGGNNVTLSQSLNGSSATLGISAPSFINGNGFSFGSNAGSVTASYTGSANVNFSAGGSSAGLSAVTFSNANGIGFGLNAGTITASHNAITSQTLQTSNIIQAAAAAGTGNNSTMTNGTLLFSNSNSITFGLSNGVLTASAAPDGIQGISVNGSSVGNGTVVFSNSNNINFGLNGSVVTASVNVAGGGIALANSQTTFTSGTAYLNAASGAITIGSSVSNNSQSFNFSVPATSSLTASNISLVTNGNTIGFVGQSMFDGGMIGGGAGSTLGTSGSSLTAGMALAAGSNVTLSQSTNASGAYITVNAPGGTISNWEPIQLQHVYSTTSIMSYITNSNLYLYKLQVPSYVNATQFMQYAQLSMSASSNSTYTGGISMNVGIYTAAAGVSSLNLITQSTGSSAFAFTNSSGNSSNSASSYFNGLRGLIVPMNVSFSPGNYFLGVISRSTYTNAVLTAANMMVMSPTMSFNGLIGQLPNSTQGIQEAIGQYTGATTLTTLPTVVPMSQIIQFSNRSTPYFFFKGVTW